MENQIPLKAQDWKDYALTTEARINTFLISKVSNYQEFLLIQEYKDKQFYFDFKYTFGLL